MKQITFCYVTFRRDCRLEWFLESLAKQTETLCRVLVITPHRTRLSEIVWHDDRAKVFATFHEPKPNVWSGPHRLTSQDYFSAANARNTAAALCQTEWIAYVDDLSVLCPHWLQSVREAMAGNYVVLGAYQKVLNLKVTDGVPIYETHPPGMDSRLMLAQGDITPCGGDWCFGCSMALPLEWLLNVGGLPEHCDGLGFEDVIFGLALQNNGYPLRYDRRMMTLESEELHHIEPAAKRIDKGISPSDKSHAVLNQMLGGRKYFENYYEGGIRALREYILAGNPFPIVQHPTTDWYDSQPISEL